MEKVDDKLNHQASSVALRARRILTASIVFIILLISVFFHAKVGATRSTPELPAVASYEILHAFTGNAGYGFNGDTDGANPYGPIMQGPDGNFYGTTMNGSATATNPTGTIYKMNAAGQITILHHFANTVAEGVSPMSGLTLAKDGNLYGTTYNAAGCTGSGAGCGVLFRISPSGDYHWLFTFSGTEGGLPQAGVIQAKDGLLYGTTTKGGYDGRYVYGGTVYKIRPGSTQPAYVHLFTRTDGVAPSCDLIQGQDGALYGTAFAGATGTGSVFRLTTGGAFTVLHSFAAADGAYPIGGLTQAADGTLYGTTSAGGQYNLGVVYKITPGGVFSIIHTFTFTEGGKPYGNLLSANDGNLYGTTNQGGRNYGTVFKLTPAGSLTVLHTFGEITGDGAYPTAGLIQASDGRLYGTTKSGGPQNKGTVFRLDLGLTPAATPSPTPTPTSTPRPSPSPGVTPPPGPSPTPTASPTPQPSPSPGSGCANNTCGEVHGNGRLEDRTDGTHFDFRVRFVRPDRSPRGSISFVDRETRMRFRSTEITCLVFSESHATISGNGEADGQPVTFTLELEEKTRNEAGTFSIVLSNGYRKSGVPKGSKVDLIPCRNAHALAAGNHASAYEGPSQLTNANWHNQPSIVAIRKIVSSINGGLKKGIYNRTKREFESCGDQYYTRRIIARNAKGTIVWYQEFFTYEDGSYNFDYYYDDTGHLRFVLGNAHAANGTHDQHRIYFDGSAKRLWETGNLLKGPGCAGCFPDPYPENQLPFDPEKAFAHSEGCVDAKPQPPRSKKKK